jgi:cytoskeleton protein RodZ
MSDVPPIEPQQPAAVTAGSLLRQARVAKGLHIAALATSIKVAPRKLELLESDRFDELPGATFTRALAQTVCRSLKIDPAPVLALLPLPVEQSLSQMGLGLNAPFRDRPGRRVPSDLQFMRSPVVLGAVLLVLASVALYLLPAGWINDVAQQPEVVNEPAAPAVTSSPSPTLAELASVPALTASGVADVALPTAVPAAASAPAPEASQVVASPAPATGVLLLRTSAESWVEVIDGRGSPLLSRMLQPGETVGLDGASPLRVRIGNASATQVSFRGKPVLLTPTRDNVAKVELR